MAMEGRAFALFVLFLFITLWVSANAFVATQTDLRLHSKLKEVFAVESPPIMAMSARSSRNSASNGPPTRPYQKSKKVRRHKKSGINNGKKVGLLFAGIAVLLQVAMVTYLLLKRKQMLDLVRNYAESSN
uniref:Transmembrane protein n=1 Tax=Picea sitchensis TaxID=3332 RepID=A9NTW2_PICSI|nr:unknown [Picea sitchensis]